MKHSKIAFIGAGQMAEAIIKGIQQNKAVANSSMVFFDKKNSRKKYIEKNYKLEACDDIRSAVAFANINIIAVKPQDMETVLKTMKPFVTKYQLVISIAAGITLETLQKYFKKVPVIRSMPNNPAMVGAGITALSAGSFCGENHLKQADYIFNNIGVTEHLPEQFMDAVTALSGSGPAFVYLFLENLINAAVKEKLPQQTARRLALQTLTGSVKTAQLSEKPFKKLIEMVTSKKGTTEAGLKVLKKFKFDKAIQGAILAAAKRSKELSK